MKTSKDVADYLADLIKKSGKTQALIAKEAGFASPNMITMLKTGKSKIPLGRVQAIASSLGSDPGELFNQCLQAYDPELYRVVAVACPAMLISQKEFKIIQALRAASRSGAFAT